MSPIERARAFIRSQVQDPALEHPLLSKEVKAKVKNTNIWLTHFRRVGDLIEYINRFELGTNDPTYQAMHTLGLKTFEDIAETFERDFALWANDRTRPTDFIVGETYSAHEILIFARNFDTRAGGMFVLESGGKPECVVIKATLNGGRYANAWLDHSNRLKYYLKSKTNPKNGQVTFGEKFKPNAAILQSPDLPILTFVRQTENSPFVYQGVFKFVAKTNEADGSKWFELKRDVLEPGVIQDAAFQVQNLVEEVKKSAQSSRDLRRSRLAMASKMPKKITVLTTAFIRNPDVIVEVLERAEGYCEACHEPAPFLKRSDGEPYLEVHHRRPLAQGGEDSVENAIALCPNCHRKSHFG